VLSAEDQASDKFCSNVMSAYSVHIAGNRAQSVSLTLISDVILRTRQRCWICPSNGGPSVSTDIYLSACCPDDAVIFGQTGTLTAF
jgi:hypothetical protein